MIVSDIPGLTNEQSVLLSGVQYQQLSQHSQLSPSLSLRLLSYCWSSLEGGQAVCVVCDVHVGNLVTLGAHLHTMSSTYTQFTCAYA